MNQHSEKEFGDQFEKKVAFSFGTEPWVEVCVKNSYLSSIGSALKEKKIRKLPILPRFLHRPRFFHY